MIFPFPHIFCKRETLITITTSQRQSPFFTRKEQQIFLAYSCNKISYVDFREKAKV